MINDEKKHYWIALFNDYTYDILYNTYQGAIEWCKMYKPQKRKSKACIRRLAEMGGLRRIKKTKKSALKIPKPLDKIK